MKRSVMRIGFMNTAGRRGSDGADFWRNSQEHSEKRANDAIAADNKAARQAPFAGCKPAQITSGEAVAAGRRYPNPNEPCRWQGALWRRAKLDAAVRQGGLEGGRSPVQSTKR